MESTDYLCQRLKDTDDLKEKYSIIDQLKLRLDQLEEEKFIINQKHSILLDNLNKMIMKRQAQTS